MTNTLWNPDVEVAVHDGELIVTLDHLPERHRFEAEFEGGEILVLSENFLGEVDHGIHLPLPDGLEISSLSMALNGEAFELRMIVPAL